MNENGSESPSTDPEPTNPGNAGLRTRTPNSANSQSDTPRGWYSRGYLPHFDSNAVIQHVTIHLADSLPQDTVRRLLSALDHLDPECYEAEKRRRLQALLDTGNGACWLLRPDCARIVQDALLYFDGARYRMLEWVIMPNHVHALFQTIDGWNLNIVVGSWKTFTANAIGRLVREPNEPQPRVWHLDFWDRYIRDRSHFLNTVTYIHNNPVQAGLVPRSDLWPWSSATSERGALPGNAGLRTRIWADSSPYPLSITGPPPNGALPGNAGLRTRIWADSSPYPLSITGPPPNGALPGNAGLRTRI